MAENENDDLVIFHPNREKAVSTLTKLIVIVILVVSAVMIAIVTLGGWSSLQGAQPVSVIYILVYLVMAYYVARWNRGVLPLAAGLAILLAAFGALAAPAWFERSFTGFDNPGLPPDLLGAICTLLIPVQLLLIVISMLGFRQAWNVEVEMTREEAERRRRQEQSSSRGRRPAPEG